MQAMKLVVVLLALLLLVWLVLGSVRRRAKGSRRESVAATPPHPAAHGQAYCSEAHRDSGPGAP
jgi:hypothetical protein